MINWISCSAPHARRRGNGDGSAEYEIRTERKGIAAAVAVAAKSGGELLGEHERGVIVCVAALEKMKNVAPVFVCLAP